MSMESGFTQPAGDGFAQPTGTNFAAAAGNSFAPPAGALTSDEPFVSAHGRALVVVGLFVAYILAASFSVATNVMQLALPPVVLGGEGAEQLTLAELLQLLGGLATFLFYLALAVAFPVWLYRAAKNIPALGNPKSRVESSPGWAVGSFFVPFVNLYIPYKATREVWEKSDPSVRTQDDMMFTPPGSAPLLVGWWIAWIASNVVSNISWRLMDDSPALDTRGFVIGVDILADVLGIAAAVLAIFVVRGIDRRQAERARHVIHIPNMPPPPPVFTQHYAPANAPAPGGQTR